MNVDGHKRQRWPRQNGKLGKSRGRGKCKGMSNNNIATVEGVCGDSGNWSQQDHKANESDPEAVSKYHTLQAALPNNCMMSSSLVECIMTSTKVTRFVIDGCSWLKTQPSTRLNNRTFKS